MKKNSFNRTLKKRKNLYGGTNKEIQIYITNYGVLGKALNDITPPNTVVTIGEPPVADNLAFVDPAGLRYIKNDGPSNAGGLSKAIYFFLGIISEKEFDSEIKEAIKMEGQAKLHEYKIGKDNFNKTPVNCIHVVGPDFRIPYPKELNNISVEKLSDLQRLTRAYKSVFEQFIISRKEFLRLIPISGGIFAIQNAHGKPDKKKMLELTKDAITASLNELSSNDLNKILQKEIHLCIYSMSELEGYTEAFKEKLKLTTISVPQAEQGVAIEEVAADEEKQSKYYRDYTGDEKIDNTLKVEFNIAYSTNNETATLYYNRIDMDSTAHGYGYCTKLLSKHINKVININPFIKNIHFFIESYDFENALICYLRACLKNNFTIITIKNPKLNPTSTNSFNIPYDYTYEDTKDVKKKQEIIVFANNHVEESHLIGSSSIKKRLIFTAIKDENKKHQKSYIDRVKEEDNEKNKKIKTACIKIFEKHLPYIKKTSLIIHIKNDNGDFMIILRTNTGIVIQYMDSYTNNKKMVYLLK